MKRITVLIEDEIYEFIQKAAREHNLSISKEVRNILRDAIKGDLGKNRKGIKEKILEFERILEDVSALDKEEVSRNFKLKEEFFKEIERLKRSYFKRGGD